MGAPHAGGNEKASKPSSSYPGIARSPPSARSKWYGSADRLTVYLRCFNCFTMGSFSLGSTVMGCICTYIKKSSSQSMLM